MSYQVYEPLLDLRIDNIQPTKNGLISALEFWIRTTHRVNIEFVSFLMSTVDFSLPIVHLQRWQDETKDSLEFA